MNRFHFSFITTLHSFITTPIRGPGVRDGLQTFSSGHWELSDGAGATSCFLLRPQKSICPLDPLSCYKTKLYRFLASSGANINFTPVVLRLYTSHTVTKEYRERLVGPAELSSDSDERFSLSLWFRKTEESRPKQPPLLCGPSQRTRSRFLRPLNCGAKGG